MKLYPAVLLKLVPSFVLIIISVSARTYLGSLSGDMRVIVEYMPYVFCAVAILMAYQFNRSRLLLAAIGVAVFYWVVQAYLQLSLSEPDTLRHYLAVSLVLPVLVFYLLLLPERGIWNPYGLSYTTFFFLLALVCALLGPWLQQANDAALSYYAPRPLEGYVLSYGATLLVALVTVVGLVLALVRNQEAEVALLGTFFALYLTLALLHLDSISVAMCNAAGLILLWGLLRSSHAMAYRDELTGIRGRRALNERLKMLGNQYSIAMLDIDHFKRFNDTHGHDVGDQVLRLVASRIQNVTGGGIAYRYGGEEFCIVFPRKGVEDCLEPLERVRAEIANYRMSIRDRSLRPVRSREGAPRRGATRLGSADVSVTVSIGLATRNAEYIDAEAVIAAADSKLYRAKKAGRNRLVY